MRKQSIILSAPVSGTGVPVHTGDAISLAARSQIMSRLVEIDSDIQEEEELFKHNVNCLLEEKRKLEAELEALSAEDTA